MSSTEDPSDTLELLALVTRQFKGEEARLRDHDSAASLDTDQLSEMLDDLQNSLSKCLASADRQRQSCLLAAGSAHDFYRTVSRILRTDTDRLRQREDEFNSMDNPDELIDRAEMREDELAEIKKGLKLKSAVADIAKMFEEFNSALKESLLNCAKARERASDIQEELQQAQLREEQLRRQEEEAAARRRAEELRRRQAEAEEAEARRRQREAEEAAAADAAEGGGGGGRRRRKSTSRRRAQEAEEQRRREAEAVAEAAERLWRPVVFRVADDGGGGGGGGEFDFDYACAIRAPDGAVSPNDYRCRLLTLDELDTESIPATEELVGNVVRFEAIGLTRLPLGREHRHWYILLPHCAQRQTARETVLYMLKDDRWIECPSTETHVEGLEFQTRWVETRITEPCVTIVAVNKLKTDRFSVGKPGIRFYSSVDNRISLTIPEDAVKIQLDQSMEVQPIDSTTLATIKSQHQKETLGLLTSSSIIQHTSMCKNTLRQATFSFQLPLNPSGTKKPRPGTAADARPRNGAGGPGSGRPMTARIKMHPDGAGDDDDDDEIVVVVGCDGHRNTGSGGWSVLENLEVEEEPGKDIVSFKVARFYDRRFIAFRAKPDFHLESAGRICEAIEKSLDGKTACFVLRQKSENLTEVTLALSATHRLDRTLKQLQEGGYDYDNGSGGVSEDFRVRERQQFRLRFRGNIVCEEDDPDRPSEFVVYFNSQMKNRLQLTVTERDRFAQRALDQYRGFLEVTTDVAVQRPAKDAKKGSPMVTVMEETVVAKMLICMPKSEEDLRVKSPRTTPFTFKSKDAVTMDYLRDLSELVSDGWELLAEKLEVSKKRCSVIKKNSDSVETQAYDMLITWVKKLPVLKNKVLILYRALHASGYPHLAVSLRDADKDRKLRHDSSENGDYDSSIELR